VADVAPTVEQPHRNPWAGALNCGNTVNESSRPPKRSLVNGRYQARIASNSRTYLLWPWPIGVGSHDFDVRRNLVISKSPYRSRHLSEARRGMAIHTSFAVYQIPIPRPMISELPSITINGQRYERQAHLNLRGSAYQYDADRPRYLCRAGWELPFLACAWA
jgi:hypothetical protein